jgi:hypothetical protein
MDAVASLALAACAVLLAGCGASTLRLAIAPTIDGDGRPGVESTVGLGIGTPLDFHGPSHHYLQALGSVGAGLDARTRAPSLVTTGGLDYLYWADPRLEVRAGLRFSYRRVEDAPAPTSLYGFGGHIGILPVVVGNASGPGAYHLCLGPELHAEWLTSDPAGASRALLSLPLVAELTVLTAGD